MRKHVIVLLVFLTSIASVFAAENDRLSFIYYYAWYANPYYDGEWLHWQEFKHIPPTDVSSSYYPKLGAYSSGDLTVINQHMKWIASTGINAVIYSWWGRNDFTDHLIKPILDSASDHDLKVTFLIEPYFGRTTQSICADIEYLNKKYARHPAFLRISRTTKYSPDPARRGIFFIYQPEFPIEELQQLSDIIHSHQHESLVLLQSTDAKLIDNAHADGIFAYEAVQNVMHFYEGIVKTVQTKNSIFVPCVSPGFNQNRTLRNKSAWFRARHHGATYDLWWEKTLASEAEYVAVISFNEWHEGTQIEPAIKEKLPSEPYLSYQGSYNRTGSAAEGSYLQRTARWIRLFQQLQP